MELAIQEKKYIFIENKAAAATKAELFIFHLVESCEVLADSVLFERLIVCQRKLG